MPDSSKEVLPVRSAGTSRLLVRDLVLAMGIGVYPREHGIAQKVRINLEIETVGPPAGDSIDSVVSYEAIVDRVRALAASRHFELVETLAEAIAGLCLEDRRVMGAKVRVEKPGAVPGAASVGVEIERQRL